MGVCVHSLYEKCLAADSASGSKSPGPGVAQVQRLRGPVLFPWGLRPAGWPSTHPCTARRSPSATIASCTLSGGGPTRKCA